MKGFFTFHDQVRHPYEALLVPIKFRIDFVMSNMFCCLSSVKLYEW
jgi:hypothetical protein